MLSTPCRRSPPPSHSHVDPELSGHEKGMARASRRNIILILLPYRDARPRRRRQIYGQFFLLIFITSTCERGSTTKRAPPLFLLHLSFSFFLSSSPIASPSSSFRRDRRLRPSFRYRRCTAWDGIFSSPSRDPYLIELHKLCPEGDSGYFCARGIDLDLCESIRIDSNVNNDKT